MDGHEAHESLKELPQQGHSGARKSAPQRLLPFGRCSRPHLVGLHPVIAPSAQRLDERPVREVLQSLVAP